MANGYQVDTEELDTESKCCFAGKRILPAVGSEPL